MEIRGEETSKNKFLSNFEAVWIIYFHTKNKAGGNSLLIRELLLLS